MDKEIYISVVAALYSNIFGLVVDRNDRNRVDVVVESGPLHGDEF